MFESIDIRALPDEELDDLFGGSEVTLAAKHS